MTLGFRCKPDPSRALKNGPCDLIRDVSQSIDATMRTAQEIIRDVRVTQAANGICYATAGEMTFPSTELERMILAVPRPIASALGRKAFYFVPLAVSEGDKTLIAERYD